MQTLVLIDNMPFEEVSLCKAIDLIQDGKAELVKSSNTRIYEIHKDRYNPKNFDGLNSILREEGDFLYLLFPAIVRKKTKVFWKRNAPERGAIYRRDNFECQYEGCETTKKWLKQHGTARLPAHMLNLDHVVPVSQGGPWSWTNLVTACLDCNNNKKQDRTPEKAGMRLRRKPFRPNPVDLLASKYQALLEAEDYGS